MEILFCGRKSDGFMLEGSMLNPEFGLSKTPTVPGTYVAVNGGMVVDGKRQSVTILYRKYIEDAGWQE